MLTGVYGRLLLTKPGFTQLEIKRGMMPSQVATIRFVTRQLGQRTMLGVTPVEYRARFASALVHKDQ